MNSLVATTALSRARAQPPGVNVATSTPQSLQRSAPVPPARRLTVSALRPFCSAVVPLRRAAPRVAVVPGNGSQGAAHVQALVQGGRNTVFAITRSGSQFHPASPGMHMSGARDQHLRVGDTAGLVESRFTPGPEQADLVINAANLAGLQSTLDNTPAGSKVLLTQNGIDPMTGQREGRTFAYGVSLIITEGHPGGVHVNPSGCLLVGEDTPFLETLQRGLADSDIYQLRVVRDIGRVKWEKVALNCALNAPCTVLGLSLGELEALMEADPRMDRLVSGLAHEALVLARALGVDVRDHAHVMQDIHRAQRLHARHPTSMQSMFMRDLPTEVPVLTGAVADGTAKLADTQGKAMAAPLSEGITRCMQDLESLRRPCTSHAQFLALHGERVLWWRETLLASTQQLPRAGRPLMSRTTATPAPGVGPSSNALPADASPGDGTA